MPINTAPPQEFVTVEEFQELRQDLAFLTMRQQEPLPAFLSFKEIAQVSRLAQSYVYNEAVRRGYYDKDAVRPGKKAGLWYNTAMALLNAIQDDTDFRETTIRAEKAFRSHSK